jgi:REP element-mobilizing transposase RayT
MSFWKCYYHIVWSTADREPLIQPDIERRLYPYIVNKAAELGVFVYAIDGWTDHIHLVVAIPPKHAVADVVKRLKGASSHDLNHGGAQALDRPFAWQRGYGALSLGERQLPIAKAYVANQKEHHTEHTTNTWLERDNVLDEGPSDAGIAPRSLTGVVREAGIDYDEWGEPPF